MKRVLLGVLFLSFLFMANKGETLMVGELAPDFTLSNTYEKNISLSDFKDKYVVLEWLNHDCPFVKKHYNSGNMQKLQKKFSDKGVVWLSINSSAEGNQGNYSATDANQLTVEKAAHPQEVLLDEDGTVGHLYKAKTTPHIFIIDGDGILIYQGAIDSIASSDPDDVVDAENYVESTLNSVLSGQVVTVSATKSYGCSVKY